MSNPFISSEKAPLAPYVERYPQMIALIKDHLSHAFTNAGIDDVPHIRGTLVRFLDCYQTYGADRALAGVQSFGARQMLRESLRGPLGVALGHIPAADAVTTTTEAEPMQQVAIPASSPLDDRERLKPTKERAQDAPTPTPAKKPTLAAWLESKRLKPPA